MPSTRRSAARSAALRRAAVLLAIAVLSTGLALIADRVGTHPFGTAYEDDVTCVVPAALPHGLRVAAGPSPPATASRTVLPLGFVCTVELAGQHPRKMVIPHQNWPATAIFLGALLVGLLALVIAVRTARRAFIPRHDRSWS